MKSYMHRRQEGVYAGEGESWVQRTRMQDLGAMRSNHGHQSRAKLTNSCSPSSRIVSISCPAKSSREKKCTCVIAQCHSIT